MCLQCLFIVSVMLWFKVVLSVLGKIQSIYMKIIHQLGCVSNLSSGIYCIFSIILRTGKFVVNLMFKNQ